MQLVLLTFDLSKSDPVVCDNCVHVKGCFFFFSVKRQFTDKQGSSLHDYVELSVMLEYNSLSK